MHQAKISTTEKVVIVVAIIAVLVGFGIIYYLNTKEISESSPAPSSKAKITTTPFTSPKVSASPSIAPSVLPSATLDLKIPDGETIAASSKADTNGDGKEETLVITKMANGKYHAYVLSFDGNILFDNKELNKKPVRIATQTYDSSRESYLSWMLIFTENSGDLAFIHWNGTAYEIPPSMGI